ncbi:MAG TPA: ABATE domain-containing protein [Tepidisphaeraceae bacterium]|jgi:predicted RNA-binding Zn ribbon-like protein
MPPAEFLFTANDPFLNLLNTRPDAGDDRLRTNDDLIRWMDRAGLIRAGDQPWRWNDKADPLLSRVKRLRESVRQALDARTRGEPIPPDLLAQLQRDAADAPASPSQVTRPEHLHALLARAALELLRRDPSSVRCEPTPDGQLWTDRPV